MQSGIQKLLVFDNNIDEFAKDAKNLLRMKFAKNLLRIKKSGIQNLLVFDNNIDEFAKDEFAKE